MNLQTARLGPVARRTVQDAALTHRRNAATLLLGLVAHGHELLLQGLVLLLEGLFAVGGLGAGALGGLLFLLRHSLGLLLLFATALGLLLGLVVHFVGGFVCVGSVGGRRWLVFQIYLGMEQWEGWMEGILLGRRRLVLRSELRRRFSCHLS